VGLLGPGDEVSTDDEVSTVDAAVAEAVVGGAAAGEGETVLVTGGSGVVGSAVLASLAGYSVVALARRRVPSGTARTVRGDVCQPRLGLDATTYEALCGSVSTVVHLAATTNVGRGRVDHHAVNAGGTAEIARFAAAAGARLIYMSTAYVHEGISGVAAVSRYEQSKRAGEAVVRAAGVPTVVVRPSIVAGDSRTGEISAQQGLHLAVTGVVRGAMPVVPAHPDAMVDFVPQDYLAGVVRRLVDLRSDRWPSEVWVTQGTDAMRVGDMVETANRFARRLGLTHQPARCMPYETVERLFLPVFLSALPQRTQSEFRRMLQLARYMNAERPLPPAAATCAPLGLGPLPEPGPLLELNLRWWARSFAPVTRAA
jgi:nucleoside-diphosphate-sugar epimerase